MKTRNELIAAGLLVAILATRGWAAAPAVEMIVPEVAGTFYDLRASDSATPAAEKIPFITGFGHSRDEIIVLVSAESWGNVIQTYDRKTLKPGKRWPLQKGTLRAILAGPAEMAYVFGGSAYYMDIAFPTPGYPRYPFQLAKTDLATGAGTVFPLGKPVGCLCPAGETLLIIREDRLLTFSPAEGKFGTEIPVKDGAAGVSAVLYLKQAGVYVVDSGGAVRHVADGAIRPAEDPAGPWKIGMPVQQAFAVEGNGGERILALSAPVLPMNGLPATDDCSVLVLNPATRKVESEQKLNVEANASAVVSDDGTTLRICDAKAGDIVSVEMRSGKETSRAKVAGDLTERQRGGIRLIAEAATRSAQ